MRQDSYLMIGGNKPARGRQSGQGTAGHSGLIPHMQWHRTASAKAEHAPAPRQSPAAREREQRSRCQPADSQNLAPPGLDTLVFDDSGLAAVRLMLGAQRRFRRPGMQ